MSDENRIILRHAEAADEPTLWLMLTFAGSMSPDGEAAIALAKADSYLRTYVQGWGQEGDLGIIAQDPNSGVHLGAVWVRLNEKVAHFKVGDNEVPELAMAVLPSARGKGVGSAMLKKLIAIAVGKYPAIALSVREGNPAIGLYTRLGFREIGRIENRVGGASVTMRLPLPTGAQPVGADAGT